MLRIAASVAKQRYHCLQSEIKLLTANLESVLSEEHHNSFQQSTELSREKVYRTINKRLREKIETLAGIQHSYPATQHASGDIQK